ncbi:hypothetical protein SAMN05216436_11454 [bacterium A37T11]|nr:hypothetical protein SAMN05216436_11454 [bacterium A37T11]
MRIVFVKLFIYICIMTLLTIKVPDNAKTRLAKFVKELGGEVMSDSAKEAKATKKEAVLNEIRQGLAEVKQIREGKLKSFTMAGLLSEK